MDQEQESVSQEGFSPFQAENSQPNQSQENQGLSEFGSQFLANDVPEEHRAIVEQYIKPWDGNVTRKFQELQGKVKTYEGLGEVDELASAYEVLQDMRADPVGFFNYFRDYLVENAQAVQEQYGIEDINQALGIAMSNMENEMSGGDVGSLPEYEGMSPQAIQKIQFLESQLADVTSKTEDMLQSSREQDQMKILDSAISELHTKHGDFDEDFILTKIASGKTPEQAIEAYQKLTQSVVDSQSKAPALLNGPAGTPLDQVDKAKLRDPKYRKALGAEYLTRSLQS